MYEKLPHELKERGSFCLWKYEERDGRMTKVVRTPLWVFFCSRITLTNCFMANISSPLSPLKSTVILSEDMASASCIDGPRR